MVQFLLDNKHQVIKEYAAGLSVLDYLRLEKRKIGTKEGCAAGDCGACTVVTGELQQGKLHYQAVNACITPLGSLDGKQLITIENLAEQATLHPVQESMVNCHGSQCGFCTPGIVMSLFAWWQSIKSGEVQASHENIEQALSGNLCRCTGYKPIFNAAWESLNSDVSQQFRQQQLEIIEKLQSFKPDGIAEKQEHTDEPSIDENSIDQSAGFLSPRTLAELNDYRASFPDATLIAGATDLGLTFTQDLDKHERLIYTGQIIEMKNVEQLSTSLKIGAAVTYSEMQQVLNKLYPAFGQLLYRLGSLQVRNQGTLGGNLANASPIGDTPPVVLALDGKIHLHSMEGQRTLLANEFFTAYRQTAMESNECIVSIELPLLEEDEELFVYKVSKRFDDDISAICVAIWIKFDHQSQLEKCVADIRIAYGGMAATPLRAGHTEEALRGKAFEKGSIHFAELGLKKDFQPIDDVRASAAYRMEIAGTLLLRAMLELEGNHAVNLFDQHENDSKHSNEQGASNA